MSDSGNPAETSDAIEVVPLSDEQKKLKEEERRRRVLEENNVLSFKVLEELGLERPAIGREMRVTVVERVMNYWPNSKQVRVLDANKETRSIFFYIDEPEPNFSYEDLQEGNILVLFEPRAHFFMDGQIGLRIEERETVSKIEKVHFDQFERLTFAQAEKVVGNKWFAEKKYEQALDRYGSAIKHTDNIPERDQKLEELKTDLLVSCHLNVAFCLLQTKKYDLCVQNCLKANEKRETGKAYFRMAEAQYLNHELNRAEENYARAHNLEPSDKLILKRLNEVRQEIREQKQTDKNLFGGIFNKKNNAM